jgi:single-stranded DNA-binding protein
MTVAVMVTGALAKEPMQRTSKNGAVYLTTSLRVTTGNETEWWNLLCFSESAQAEIKRLGVGEKLTCQGSLKIEIYRAGDGEPKISRTIFVDAVLALRPPPRERKPKAAPDRRHAGDAAPSNQNDGRDFDDSIPF